MKTVLFQSCQFSISHLFALSLKCQTFLFDPYKGAFQVLVLWVRTDQGAMAIKGQQHYWSLTTTLFNVISRTLVWGKGSNHSAEMQLVYSTASANWAKSLEVYFFLECYIILFFGNRVSIVESFIIIPNIFSLEKKYNNNKILVSLV